MIIPSHLCFCAIFKSRGLKEHLFLVTNPGKMPLVKRAIEPVFVCRSQLNEKIKNELEGVVVNSLSGLILQLSSLSKHAENLFGELFNEANNIFQRSTTLTRRVGDLNKSLKQMDATVKEEGTCNDN